MDRNFIDCACSDLWFTGFYTSKQNNLVTDILGWYLDLFSQPLFYNLENTILRYSLPFLEHPTLLVFSCHFPQVRYMWSLSLAALLISGVNSSHAYQRLHASTQVLLEPLPLATVD